LLQQLLMRPNHLSSLLLLALVGCVGSSDPAPGVDGSLPFASALDGQLPRDGSAASATTCESLETPFSGACYLAVGYKWMDYKAATQLCQANGARVASILSAAENQFVYALLPASNQAAWIGLKRKGGSHVWDDGTPLTYKNWAPGEPNNDNGTESCSVIWGPALGQISLRARWNDVPCASPGRDTVICKRQP